jgi:hypothetical protein
MVTITDSVSQSLEGEPSVFRELYSGVLKLFFVVP